MAIAILQLLTVFASEAAMITQVAREAEVICALSCQWLVTLRHAYSTCSALSADTDSAKDQRFHIPCCLQRHCDRQVFASVAGMICRRYWRTFRGA